MIKRKVLEMIVCPKCKGKLDCKNKESSMLCRKCRLKYKILECGIPDMLIEDAEKF